MVVFENPVMAQIFDYAVANYRGIQTDMSEVNTLGIVVPFQGNLQDFNCLIFPDIANTDLHVMAPEGLMRPDLPTPLTTIGPPALAFDIHGRVYDLKRVDDRVYIYGQHMVTTHPDILDNVAHILHYLEHRATVVVGNSRDFYSDMIPVLDLT